MREQNPKVSLQLALLTSRIARFDWPNNWTALLEFLYSSISSSDWTVSTNATQTFLQVLLVLTSKKLLSTKTQLREAAVTMIPAFAQLWTNASSQLLAFNDTYCTSSVNADEFELVTGRICNLTHHACACVKILQMLLMLSTSSPSSCSSVEPLLASILNDLSEHIDAYSSMLFVHNGGFRFVFELGEYHAAGWASLKDWEVEDDSTDVFTVGSLLDTLDFTSTVMSSPGLLTTFAPSDVVDRHSSSPSLQASLCLAMCQAKVLMSLAVIPFHMHAASSSRASIAPFSLPLLRLYHSLLLQQYRTGVSVPNCEPAAVVCTLFLSNSFSQADSTLDEFLTVSPSSPTPHSVLHSLMEILLTRLLRLSPATLVIWTDEPEELDSAMQAEAESDSLRSASEGLFASMLHHSPDLVADILVNTISDSERQLSCLSLLDSSTVSDELLFWEAVYVCCGLGSYLLSQSICKDTFIYWLSNVVGKLLTTPFTPVAETPQILHHRLLWLMSCWGYTLDADMLKQLFGILVSYLDPSRFDLMVRIQAVRSLGILMQCDDFTPDMILDVLEPLLTHTCLLVTSEVSDATVQVFVLGFFQEIVDTVGTACKPHLGTLLQHVMPLWGSDDSDSGFDPSDDNCGNKSSSPVCMIRTSLLELFTSFVNIDKGESGNALYAYIEGPLSYATSATDESAYLCQHGLTLWSALIQNCTSLSTHMVEMFNTNLPRIFNADLVGADYTELRTTLALIESYLIIGGLEFVSMFGTTISALLHLTVGKVRPRAAPHAVRPVETLLLMACSSDDSEGVMNYLLSSDIMSILIRPCLAALSTLSCNGDTTSTSFFSNVAAHFEDYLESDIALVSYLAVCARCIVMDTNFMLSCCGHIVNSTPSAGNLRGSCSDIEGALLKGICRLLIEKFDTFGYSRGGIWRRRLSCYALLCFYPSADPDLVEWLPEVLYICDDVLSEAASDDGKAKMSVLGSSIISIADDDEDDDYIDDDHDKSPLVSKFETFLAEDPTLKFMLHGFVLEKIQSLKTLLGDEALQAKVFSNLDSTTMSNLLNNSYSS